MAEYSDPEELLRELRESEGGSADFYTLLNVDRGASQDEIRRAYHSLCRIYHPDRYQDERKQKTAAEFFRRIQEAYKILSDPRTRAIYDKRGFAGLGDDMAIVERATFPSELMDEYEKLRELWEERSYIQKCNPSGKFVMEVDATPLLDATTTTTTTTNTPTAIRRRRQRHSAISVTSFSAEQSVQAHITKSSIGEVTGGVTTYSNNSNNNIGNNNNNGGGNKVVGALRFSLMHLYSSQNWLKGSLWLGNQPGLSLEAYRALTGSMYLVGNSTVRYTPGGFLTFGGTAGIHRRLNDSTSGAIILQDLGSATRVHLTHQLSPTTTLDGEVNVGQTASHVGAKVIYRPLPDYLLHTGVTAGTKGVQVLYGVKYNMDKVTAIGGTVSAGPLEGVALKMKFERASMNFALKFRLSASVGPTALFYATAIPLVLYGCIRSLAVMPLLRMQWRKEIRERKAQLAREVRERRRNAEAAVELMQETMERIVSVERAKHGLLIIEAWYGKLFDHEEDDDFSSSSNDNSPGGAEGGLLAEAKVIDVRIPLQCLVCDSKLILRERSKADLPGFYDPCAGEKKYLRARYEFRGLPHEVTVENSEPLVIPRMSHRIVNHT